MLHDNDIPSLNSETTTLHTLIVTWHWPPTNRASAHVLRRLFEAAPSGAFRVLTRWFAEASADCSLDYDLPVERELVHWPHDDQVTPGWALMPAVASTIRRMTHKADEVHRRQRVDRVLAVYPHRYSLLAGWWIARRLSLPLIVYMHDLLAEGSVFRNPLRRRFWRAFDYQCLRDASLVIVPTAEFAEHYRRRGIEKSWVLPHCTSRGHMPLQLPPARRDLHLIYSGNVYEPHFGAIEAYAAAVRGAKDVKAMFFSPPQACHGLLGNMGASWKPNDQVQRAIESADVAVVVLGSHTVCHNETMGCFPSKLIDYLEIGRPILAIVPRYSFVDRFVRETGCGLVVNSHDVASIDRAIQLLRDRNTRDQLAGAGRKVLSELLADKWMPMLLRQLTSADGPFRGKARFAKAKWTCDRCRGDSQSHTPRRALASVEF